MRPIDFSPLVSARPPRGARSLATVLLPLLMLIGCTTGGVGSPSPIASIAPGPSLLATATPPPFPASLTDDEGTSVAIPAEPHKIVSLTPAATEILFAIGAGSKVVARVEDVANYPPAATKVPVVATYQGVDVEKIVAAGADLVVSGGASFGQGPAVEQLRRANIPVVVLAPNTTAQVIADIRLVGQAAGAAQAADALADSMATQFDAIRAVTATIAHPKVFYEVDASAQIYTAADGSFLAEMLQLAGADPVTTGSTTNYQISLETLVTDNPALILLGDAAYGVTAGQVKARPGWSTIRAVKTGSIVAVDDTVITRPGPRLVLGLLDLLRGIHPELALPCGLPSGEPPAPDASPGASAAGGEPVGSPGC